MTDLLDTDLLDAAADAVMVFVIAYFLVLNTWYLVLLVMGTRELRRSQRATPVAGYDDLFASPLTPPVSVVVAARNEQATIVESVWALLELHYPAFEVIVVDDGSDDDTFALLEDTFALVQVPKVVPELVPVSGLIRSVHVAAGGEPLTVVRKASVGNKADPKNVGINAARFPLVCFVDADSILDVDALLRAGKPFFDDPRRTVAVGGTVRAVNGSRLRRGTLIESGAPRSWLVRIQVVEYLRAFLFSRIGWSRLNALFIIPGAFGVYRRSVLIDIGGFRQNPAGEDIDIVPRIHRRLRERKTDYRVAFVAEPVCWTEVPERIKDLAVQRRRWERGLAEVLWNERRMMANPRYGRIGLGVFPYFLAFELLSPAVELLGLATAVIGVPTGAVEVSVAALFLLASLGYGMFLSIASFVTEELTLHRYERPAGLLTDLVAAFLEHVGFRQRRAWWRVRGLFDALSRREQRWGRPSRVGFRADAAGPELAVTPFRRRERRERPVTA